MPAVPECLTFPEKPGLLQSGLRRAQYLAQRKHMTDTGPVTGKETAEGEAGRTSSVALNTSNGASEESPCDQYPRTQGSPASAPETLQGSHSGKPVYYRLREGQWCPEAHRVDLKACHLPPTPHPTFSSQAHLVPHSRWTQFYGLTFRVLVTPSALHHQLGTEPQTRGHPGDILYSSLGNLPLGAHTQMTTVALGPTPNSLRCRPL